ncbi:hypothetical protein Vafri_16805, partial [Volvox africanus]
SNPNPTCSSAARTAAFRARIDVDTRHFRDGDGDGGGGCSGCGGDGGDGAGETAFSDMQPSVDVLAGSDTARSVPVRAATAASNEVDERATMDPWVNAAVGDRKRGRVWPQSAFADAADDDSFADKDGIKRRLQGWPPTPSSFPLPRPTSEGPLPRQGSHLSPYSHGAMPLRTIQSQPEQQSAVAPIAEPHWDVAHVLAGTQSKRDVDSSSAVAVAVALMGTAVPGHDAVMAAPLPANAGDQAPDAVPAAPAAAAAAAAPPPLPLPPAVLTTATTAPATAAVPQSGTGTGRNAAAPPHFVLRVKLRRPAAMVQPHSQLPLLPTPHHSWAAPKPPLQPLQPLQPLRTTRRSKRNAAERRDTRGDSPEGRGESDGAGEMERVIGNGPPGPIARSPTVSGSGPPGVLVVEPQSQMAQSAVSSKRRGASCGIVVNHAAGGDTTGGGRGGCGGSPPARQNLQYDNETERRGSGSVDCTTNITETDLDGGEVGGWVTISAIRRKQSSTQPRSRSPTPRRKMPYRFSGKDLDTATRQTR